MSYLIFLGLGLSTVVWGLRTEEEVARLAATIIGAFFLVWGLFLTPQNLLILAEIVAVVAIFRICVRCCECDS